MMYMLIVAASLIWGVPLALLVVAGIAALLSTRVRAYLRRTLIAE